MRCNLVSIYWFIYLLLSIYWFYLFIYVSNCHCRKELVNMLQKVEIITCLLRLSVRVTSLNMARSLRFDRKSLYSFDTLLIGRWNYLPLYWKFSMMLRLHSVKSDWLLNTQWIVLQADWSVLGSNQNITSPIMIWMYVIPA